MPDGEIGVVGCPLAKFAADVMFCVIVVSYIAVPIVPLIALSTTGVLASLDADGIIASPIIVVLPPLALLIWA